MIRITKHDFDCSDCHVNTLEIGEYYLIKDEVWNTVAIPSIMLCIGCLETRLGRLLAPDDFIEAPVNDPNELHPGSGKKKSPRLLSRLRWNPL